jgi:hypothetical protein
MVCVLIFGQLVTYTLAVTLLALLGWLSDRLTQPLAPKRPPTRAGVAPSEFDR